MDTLCSLLTLATASDLQEYQEIKRAKSRYTAIRARRCVTTVLVCFHLENTDGLGQQYYGKNKKEEGYKGFDACYSIHVLLIAHRH